MPGEEEMHKLIGRVSAICCTVALPALATSSASADSVNALVVGKVIRCGDPSHTACASQRHVVVSVFNARHQRVAVESITNAHFSFLLKPGRYSLSARRRDGRSAGRPVTVRADETKRTTIVFHIPDFTNG
jgi:hypothetical protein